MFDIGTIPFLTFDNGPNLLEITDSLILPEHEGQWLLTYTITFFVGFDFSNP